MIIGRAGMLVLERSEFGTRIFSLVLAGNYTMGEALEFGVALLTVLLKACDTIVGRLEFLLKRSDIVSMLTQVG
jgi:hypothetical protein